MLFLSSTNLFQNQLFQKKNLSGMPLVAKNLDPDQARHFVGPDLGPNCLQSYQLSLAGKVCYIIWFRVTVISLQIKVNKCSLYKDLRGFLKKISELIITYEK